MRRLGNRVFTLETVTGGAGFRERSVASLMTSDVFVGWLPGTDPQYEDAPSPPPATADRAVTDAPPTPASTTEAQPPPPVPAATAQ